MQISAVKTATDFILSLDAAGERASAAFNLVDISSLTIDEFVALLTNRLGCSCICPPDSFDNGIRAKFIVEVDVPWEDHMESVEESVEEEVSEAVEALTPKEELEESGVI